MGLHRQVVEGLGRRIGQGDLRPGEVADITEVQGRYGASRTAVREAIKVLSAKGLIAARPRYGTYVRPRGEWNAFDADVLQWQDGSASSLRWLCTPPRGRGRRAPPGDGCAPPPRCGASWSRRRRASPPAGAGVPSLERCT